MRKKSAKKIESVNEEMPKLETRKYRTLSCIRMNDKLYNPGVILTLDNSTARYLEKQNALEEIRPK